MNRVGLLKLLSAASPARVYVVAIDRFQMNFSGVLNRAIRLITENQPVAPFDADEDGEHRPPHIQLARRPLSRN